MIFISLKIFYYLIFHYYLLFLIFRTILFMYFFLLHKNLFLTNDFSYLNNLSQKVEVILIYLQYIHH